MEDRLHEDNIASSYDSYLHQKDPQYSRELSEVRSHLEERVKEVKTDLEKDIQNVQQNLQRVEDNLQRVEDNLKNDLRDRISDLRWFIGIFVTSGIAITGIIVTLLVKFLN